MNILVTKTTNVSPPDQQRCCRGELNMRWWLTNASSKVWVQLISEKRLRQLTEIQLQCSRDGVYVHLPHHESHVLVVCKTNETSVSIYQGVQELWGKKKKKKYWAGWKSISQDSFLTFVFTSSIFVLKQLSLFPKFKVNSLESKAAFSAWMSVATPDTL